jgi:hypothetical protein
LNSASSFLTAEGASKLVSRLAGGIIYEIPNYITAYLGATTANAAGQALGNLAQLVFNYSI